MWAADPETGEAGARPVTALIEGEGVKDLGTVSTVSGSVVTCPEFRGAIRLDLAATSVSAWVSC